MGGLERIERQHAQGKLTVRERIALLADPGFFRESMGLAGEGTYEDGRLVNFRPRASVEGFCTLYRRKVVVSGGDFTSRGGSGMLGTEMAGNRRAVEWRLPFVCLLDAAGGSVRCFAELGRTYLPEGNVWSAIDVQILRSVPVISAVLGSVAGLPQSMPALPTSI